MGTRRTVAANRLFPQASERAGRTVIRRLKRLTTLPETWLLIWGMGVIAGVLADSDRLAIIPFAIAAPVAIALTLADLYRSRANQEAEPSDQASPTAVCQRSDCNAR